MDALSDVLRAVRLSGAVYLDGKFSTPWSVIGYTSAGIWSGFLPDADRIVPFHFITEGECWAHLPDLSLAPLHLVEGDVVVVPQGEPHVLCSAVGLDPVPSGALFAKQLRRTPGEMISLRHGGGGAPTRMVCGFLAGDRLFGNPLLAALPRMFKVGMRGTDAEWLGTSLRFAAGQTAVARPGGATVLGKISELVFIEAVLRFTEAIPPEQKGWLAGLRDRFVGRALMLMHDRPGHPWTIAELSRAVGLSRSALADRFVDVLGQPPMQYLAHWRLQVAASQLQSGERPVATVAEAVGYESEAAFSRAFKRAFGLPPAAWRRRAPTTSR